VKKPEGEEKRRVDTEGEKDEEREGSETDDCARGE
jgi:hypothetical protein